MFYRVYSIAFYIHGWNLLLDINVWEYSKFIGIKNNCLIFIETRSKFWWKLRIKRTQNNWNIKNSQVHERNQWLWLDMLLEAILHGMVWLKFKQNMYFSFYDFRYLFLNRFVSFHSISIIHIAFVALSAKKKFKPLSNQYFQASYSWFIYFAKQVCFSMELIRRKQLAKHQTDLLKRIY